jgi:hypothetical protein
MLRCSKDTVLLPSDDHHQVPAAGLRLTPTASQRTLSTGENRVCGSQQEPGVTECLDTCADFGRVSRSQNRCHRV